MTREAYMEALERIERGNPNEPLLATLRGGFTRLNVVYLKSALGRLTVPATKGVCQVVITSSAEEKPADDVLKSLYKQQQVLRGEKAKIANELHNCTTTEQRREVSRRILEKDATIRANEAKILHYTAHNALPSEDEEDEFYLPDDPIALMKKANSIASQISQTKKKLDELGALGPSDPARGEIGKYQGKLDRLKLYKGYADQKIKAASV